MDNFFRKLVATSKLIASIWESDNDGSKIQESHALHASRGNQHAIVFKSLRVIIVQDDGLFFAQSLDIDYAASGCTVEEAQKNFEDGLFATLKLHLEEFGNIEQIMQQPSTESIADLLKEEHGTYGLTSISHHNIESCSLLDGRLTLPFNKISYEGYLAA